MTPPAFRLSTLISSFHNALLSAAAAKPPRKTMAGDLSICFHVSIMDSMNDYTRVLLDAV